MHLCLKCCIRTISITFCLDRYITNSAKFAKAFLQFGFCDSEEQATDI